MLSQVLRERQRGGQGGASGELLHALDLDEDVLFGLLAKARDGADLLLGGGGSQGVEVADAQGVIEGLDALWSEALDLDEVEQARVELLEELVASLA